MTSATNAVPRSKLRVTLATRQPSFSSPTRLITGTRTSSRKTSQNSVVPSIARSGRTSMPGASIGTISQVIPACLRTSGSGFVRTSISQYSATWPKLVQIFWPLSTYSSPSRSARVRRLARSDPAFGSEKPWHQTCSPLSIAGRWKAFCSGGAFGDQGRAGVELGDEVAAHVRRTRPLGLLDVDEVLGGRGAAAAELLRPVDPRVPGVEQRALPAGVVLAPPGPVVLLGLRRQRRHDLLEPRAQLPAKRFLFLGVPEVHAARSVSPIEPASVQARYSDA